MSKLSGALREIDLHVVALQLFLVPWVLLLSLSGPWVLAGVALFPQGIILTRTLVDYPAFKRPAGAYLVVNQILVGMFVIACWAFSRWARGS